MPLFAKLNNEDQALILAWFKNVIIKGLPGEKAEELIKKFEESRGEIDMVYGPQIAISKEWRKQRMEGKIEGKIEAIFELLEDYGPINEDLRERIIGETKMETLKKWHKLAAKVSSIDEFVKQLSIC